MDVERVLGLEAREVSLREDGVRVIAASRTYDTTVEDLWDAITNPERLPRWFLPVSGDLRPGGHYQLEGNAGGEIVRCEPPRELGLTWVWQDKSSEVRVWLSEDASGGTHLRLEHSESGPADFWDQYGPGAGGVGWDMALMGLAEHLSKQPEVTPADAMAWMVSEEGHRFVRVSSAAWRDASIRAGTDPEAARAAAERTTAFYTGEAGPQEA